jgi:ATP-binding cassette subfamily F protein uup
VLDRVTTKVLEIDRGKAYLHVPTGWSAGSGYAAYLSGRSEREEQAATAEQVRKNLAKTELAWLRRGAPARTTKAKARVASATALVNTKAEAPARQGELGLTKDLGSKRLGSKGVELHGVGFSWPNGKRVLSPFDHMLEPGDRLGIVGPNGAGKSTLLDLISERLIPTEGKIDIGRTVKIGYYDQLGRDLDVTKRVRDAVAGDKGAPSLEDINLMKRFWFDGDSQFAEISTLSGGERRRLQLLLTLIEQPNVLLLDEPTNDLDLDTLRALEDFLDDWPGIVLVVSHDRAFLDRTVDEVFALDGQGGASLVRGGVAGWLKQRLERGSKPTQNTKSVSSAKVDAPVKAVVDVPASKSSSLKSASTLKRLVAQAEKALAQATTERDTISAKLIAEASSASSNHETLAKLSEQLAHAQTKVDTAEESWLNFAAEAESRGIDMS